MTTKQELLPCPFCGSVPERLEAPFTAENVRCQEDGCAGRSAWASVAAWNRRATTPAPDVRAIEALDRIERTTQERQTQVIAQEALATLKGDSHGRQD